MRKTRSQTQAENAQSAASVAPLLQSQPQPQSHSHSYVSGSASLFPDYEDLRNKVLCFRVTELQKLLTIFKVNHNGRKNELLSRALELLKINFNEVAPKVRDIYKSCSRDGNNSPSEYGPPDPKRMFQPQIQLPVQSDVRTTLVSNNIVVPFAGNMNSTFPIHPDVRLKKLAFYDILAQLLQPSTLVPTTTQRVQEQLFQFTLTPQQATEIASNRDIRNGSKVEHTIQVQLRFCLLETSCEQDDCFPPNVMLKVNNKVCALPNPIPTNRPNVEPTRPPRPVNVTPNVKLSPTVANNIVVQWVPDFTRGYVISGYLVRKLTSSQLLLRMKSKGIKPADYTRALIKEKLNEDADCEIATTMLRVSLLCPLGKMRMNIPCRASTCSHLQCFDASLYLQMNERKPTWNCPVCDRPATYDTLVIDGYFQEVLASQLLSPDDNEIQLHKDGSWSTHNLKNEAQVLDNSFCKTVQKVEVISDDLEVITTEPETRLATKPLAPVSSTLATASSNNEPTSTTSNETVDLTLSDSEDDLPLKKRVASAKSSNTNGNGQKNMPNSNSTTSGKLKANGFAMPKKVTKRSRGSREVKNDPKVRKVAKTGAERIREYRARIKAIANEAAAATNVEGMAIQIGSQQNLEDNQVDMRENQRSLLYEALSRKSSRDEQEAGDNDRQFVVQDNVHQQDLPLFSEAPSTSTMQMQSSSQNVTTLRRHSKTAMYRPNFSRRKLVTFQQLFGMKLLRRRFDRREGRYNEERSRKRAIHCISNTRQAIE